LRLRLPYARNPGATVPLCETHSVASYGTTISQSGYSLLATLASLLREQVFLDIIMKESDLAVIPELFVYLLSMYTWQAALRSLSEEIRETSLYRIREPTFDMNADLHNYRECLVQIQDGIREALDTARGDVSAYCHEQSFPGLRSVRREAESVEKMLMDTFQLLTSSLSAKDSQTGILLSRRVTLVTWLAFFYVPLSFVTGIFGMNVREINGSPISVWVCFVALAVVLAMTAIGFATYQTVRFFRQQPGGKRRTLTRTLRNVRRSDAAGKSSAFHAGDEWEQDSQCDAESGARVDYSSPHAKAS